MQTVSNEAGMELREDFFFCSSTMLDRFFEHSPTTLKYTYDMDRLSVTYANFDSFGRATRGMMLKVSLEPKGDED